MTPLIDNNGSIRFGFYNNSIGHINYPEYMLETPMGLRVPNWLKKIMFNQFVFLGIVGPELIAGVAVVDLKYLSNGFIYLYDRTIGTLKEMKKMGFPCAKALIAPHPDRINARFDGGGLSIKILESKFHAHGGEISLDAELAIDKVTPLRLCTRAGYRGWVYMQKSVPVPISGNMTCGGRQYDLGKDCLALVDWTGGYMRRKTYWNWAATAYRLPDGRELGLNLSCGSNETSFTENAFWLDGRMTKADTVNFVYDRSEVYGRWFITTFDKKVDLVFRPEKHKEEKINALVVASRFTQLLGTFEGELATDEGEVVKISNCPGFLEDHYAKW